MSDMKYQAGGPEYLYPEAGDQAPIEGAKVQLLTIGKVHATGSWDPTYCLGWLPLPKRNQVKEDAIQKRKEDAKSR